jgi:hypothetical protein
MGTHESPGHSSIHNARSEGGSHRGCLLKVTPRTGEPRNATHLLLAVHHDQRGPQGMRGPLGRRRDLRRVSCNPRVRR